MDKFKPTYALAEVKALIASGRCEVTVVAARDGAALGFDKPAVIDEVLKLERQEFYKSMTSYDSHKEWQDVYHHNSARGMLYIKFKVVNDVLVLSFKQR